MENGRYSIISGFSNALIILGWVLLIVGAVILVIGLAQLAQMHSNNQYDPIAIYMSILKIGSGISLAISGLILVGLGQAIRVFIDIAVNTAPLERIADNTAKTVRFFEHITNPRQPQAKPVSPSRRPAEGLVFNYPPGHE